MADMDEVVHVMRRVVRLLVDKAFEQAKDELPAMHQGTVTAVYAAGAQSPALAYPTVNVQIGSGTFTNLRYSNTLTLAVNDVVWVQTQGYDRFVAHVLA